MSSTTDRNPADQTILSTSCSTSGASEKATTIPAVDPLNNDCGDRSEKPANHPPVAPLAPVSRRGLIMNSIVSAVAVATATAIPSQGMTSPAKTPNTPTTKDTERASCLPRAEEAIGLLRTRYIREGWKIDEAAADRALAFCRHYAADGSEPDEEREAAIDFFHNHGISLDWIFCGDVGGLICSVAKNSPRANSIADAELLGLAEEYLEAERRAFDLIGAVNRIEDNLLVDRRNRAIPDALRWHESDAELGFVRPKDDVWRNENTVLRLRGEKWPVVSSVDTADEFSTNVRMVAPSAAERARAQEIIDAYDEWNRKQKPPRGYKKLLRERERALRIADRLLDRVAERPAATIQGLFAKVRCAVGPEQDIENAAIDLLGNPAGDMALAMFYDVEKLAKMA